MGIRVLRRPATTDEIQDMLRELQTYIKLAVDTTSGAVAGGGEYHADCEAALLDEGGKQEDIWGADWYPETRTVRFGALINIRPRQGNRGMEIENLALRKRIEEIVRRVLDVDVQ